MPNFYMMIGLPGSGKSTFVKEQVNKNSNSVWVSSDDIRKELFGSEEVQDNSSLVFETMSKRTCEGLKKGCNVYYDATNISARRRKALLNRLPKCRKIAYFMSTDYTETLKRNSARDRKVPEYVISRMYKNLQIPTLNEGFDEIITIKS